MSEDTPDRPEFDDPPGDPLALVRQWVDGAVQNGVPDPLAASLATVGPDGAPSVRFVALTEVTGDGVVFATSTESPKARDIDAQPQVALALHWPDTGQQIRIVGRVTALDDAASDRLFDHLPRDAQASVITARQSEPLPSDRELRQAVRELAHSPQALTRPATWRGMLVTPSAVQFWAASEDKVHRRLAYTRSAGAWTSVRLQP